MATLEIRKKSLKTWLHVPSDASNFILSKFYCKTDSNTFKIVEESGSNRREYSYTNITVYDDTDIGTPETFASAQALMLRLEALKYTGFNRDGDIPTSYIESVVAGTNVTIDDTDPLNPIISSTGGGGTQNLNEVLVEGNTTGGENISISSGDSIILDNGSLLKKGTIDAGYGGANGISQICAVGYELKWEAGRLYVMGDGGTTIREVSHNFTTTPATTDDISKGFIVGSRWILDDGDLYVCTDNTSTAAVWVLQPNIPTKTSDLINDGDNGTSHFISLEDLPSTLTVYPTTVASGIGGYNKLVSSITDPDYNTTAVDVSTGAITGTDQLIAGLITDQNQIVGNPGVFNITTIGNIRKTAGSGQAEFFFRVYKRDSGGTETLILQSNNTQQITSAIYAEFFANGLWNDGIFVSTDRIVIKFYGTKVGGGSNPTYDFQFGGTSPVRSIIPVPLNVIPSGGVPLTREEFSYTSSHDFTLSGTPSFIYAVFVNGQELNSSQYSFVTTTLTIDDALESGDKVNILYTPTSGGFLEYYTKAEIDAFDYESNHAEFIEVNALTDLPSAISGVITLVGGYTYLFLKHIDLGGSRLVCGQDTVIVGWSSENCSISSTGLSSGTALVTSVYSLPIRNISFTHALVFDLQGDGTTTALDWFGVNLLNCASGGTIKNYTNFVAGDSALLNSGGFIFDGTIGTIAFSNCLFDTASTKTAITVLSTCTVSRRLRIIYSSFVTLSGETGVNFNSSATVGDEKYILDTCNFSGGGTYISGFDATSNKSLFSNCVGITNTSTRGFLHMLDNTTATAITGTASYFKAAGTTTASSANSKFTSPSSNRLTYIGAFTQSFFVTVNCNVRTSVSTQTINIVIVKNGTNISESEMTILCAAGSTPSFGGTQAVIELTANDYIELFVRNTSSVNNVIVSDLNMNILKIPV
jgi:hypothetical protein